MSLIFKKILLLIFISVIVSAITILIILIVNKNNNPTLHTPKTTVTGASTCWTGGGSSPCSNLLEHDRNNLRQLITKDHCSWDKDEQGNDKMSCSLGDINLDSPFPNSNPPKKYRDYLHCVCHGNGWCNSASSLDTCDCKPDYSSDDSCYSKTNKTILCTGTGYYKVPYPKPLTYNCNNGDTIQLKDTNSKMTFANSGSWQDNETPLTEPFSWWQRIHTFNGGTSTSISITVGNDNTGWADIGKYKKDTIWLKLTYGANQHIRIKPITEYGHTRTYSSDWIFENFSGITFFDEQTTYGNIMSCKDDKNGNSIQSNCYPGSQYTIRFRYQHDGGRKCVDLENGGVYQTMAYTIYPPKDANKLLSDYFWTETGNEVLVYIGGDKYMSDDKNKPLEARCCTSQAPDGACS